MSGFYPDLLARGKEHQHTPKQIVEKINQANQQVTYDAKTVELPIDYSTKLSPDAKRWLLKYGITEQEKTKHCFGYSPSLNRVILPVYKTGFGCVFWQGRALGNGKPKYLSVSAKGADKYFEVECVHSKAICVVEDILSAVKVGRYCNSLALLGSYLPDSIYDRLKGYKKVFIWLDDDKYLTAVAYSKRLREFGLDVSVIKTAKDPKEMPVDDVRNLTSL
jgi:hypothetical protein